MASQEERDKLYKSLGRFVKKHKAGSVVACFGNNATTAETIRILKGSGIGVECIFDNGSEGRNEDGIAVVHPENYEVSKKTVVLIGSKYYNEMHKQLIGLGYLDKQIVQTISYADIYAPKVTAGAFFAEFWKLLKARAIYKKIFKGLDDDALLFVCPSRSTGDIYLILMYTRAYVKAKKIKNYRYVINGGAAEALCRACGVSDYVKLNMSRMFMLCKLVRFMDVPDSRLMLCNELWDYTNLAKNVMGYGRYDNFSLWYKKSMLAMKDDDASFACPFLPCESDIRKIFCDYHLVEGRTVLLAPYTNYLKPLPNEMWTKIAARLKERGFSVCTNCASESEPPVEGTIPIYLKFRDIGAFLNAAGYFIGARSGLCDVVSGSGAKLHIVYQERMESRFISSAQYYSLQKMDLAKPENIMEYVWDLQEPPAVMAERIISNIQ